MSQFEVGDWVRLTAQCQMHPCRGKEPPEREFIGIYLGGNRVSWLSAELPEYEKTHWGECLELFQRAPKADGPV